MSIAPSNQPDRPNRSPAPGAWKVVSWLSLIAGLALLVPHAIRYYRAGKVGDGCVRGCRSGFCYNPADSAFSGYCSAGCAADADCRAGLVCTGVASEGTRFCKRPPRASFGEGCSEDSDCMAGRCFRYDRTDGSSRFGQRRLFQREYCSEPCSQLGKCPPDADCSEQVLDGRHWCTPTRVIERDAARYFEALREDGIEPARF